VLFSVSVTRVIYGKPTLGQYSNTSTIHLIMYFRYYGAYCECNMGEVELTVSVTG
jgi:hypothetical protein